MSADDRDVLAGEYVLGLLDAREAADVEARAVRDPMLAAAVGRWRDRLGDLDASAAPLAPDAALWSRIDGAVGAARPAQAANAGPGFIARIWDSLALWRGAGMIGAGASAALAVALVAVHFAAPPAPVVLAVLLKPDMTPGAVVEVFGDNSANLIPLADVFVPAGRALQVWTLADPAAGPVSIGLLERARQARLAPVALPAPKVRQLYEITLEPSAGSPTGRPTGPIVFKGYAEAPR